MSMEQLNTIYSNCKESMQASLEHLEAELSKIRAGKANPNMLEGITVDAYGSKMAMNAVATISTPDARTLSIKPFDKGTLQDIEKAIFGANLGVTPQNDGETIRINIPPLTEERRIDLAKQIHAEGENCKVSLRNARKDGNSEVKKLKGGELSEDMLRDGEAEIQSITNGFGKKVDALCSAKEKEILAM